MRLDEPELPLMFNGDGNIGVLLGEPSGGLIDVDLDCPEALELAEKFLPPTPAVTGRTNSPRSHWWYFADGVTTARHQDPHNKSVLVEIRSTGAQTLVGPSTHPSGDRYEDLDGEPARVRASELVEGVESLRREILVRRYGEPPAAPGLRSCDGVPAACDEEVLRRRSEAYLDKMPPAISGHGGHIATYAAATAMVHGFGLDPETALGVLLERYNPRCEPAWTEQELRHKVEDAASKSHEKPHRWLRDAGRLRRGSRDPPDDDRPATDAAGFPTIVIDTDEHRVVDHAVAAMTADQTVFQRGGRLVRVLREQSDEGGIVRPEGSAIIADFPPAHLRVRLTRHAYFVKFGKNGGLVAAHPTGWLVAAVAARGEWEGIRRLRAVADAPILRADGTVRHAPGYDAATGVLLMPSEPFPEVHPQCDLDDASAALDELLEITCDFRFEADVHRAAWLAALLTPLARFAFSGPAPLFLIDSNVRGAGKGLLAQTIGRIVLGREMPVSSYSRESEEMRKKITAIALAGDRMVLLDNIDGKLGNDAIDRALTSTLWKDRILGKSELVEVPLLATWFATGNNVQVAADTARRVVHIRLDVLDERPEERADFAHADLVGWVAENRGRLLIAALTILSAYIRAGRPRNGLTPLGSFEQWSSLVREAVVWVGMPDPCLTRARLAATSDLALEQLTTLIDAWIAYDSAAGGIVLSELISALYPSRGEAPADEASAAMRDAIENLIATCNSGPPTARQFGNRLKAMRRRVVNGRYIDFDPAEKRPRGALWRLHATDREPLHDSADSAESLPAPEKIEGEE